MHVLWGKKKIRSVDGQYFIIVNRVSRIRASQNFLDPIQNRALSRSVQLKAVYLEALL